MIESEWLHLPADSVPHLIEDDLVVGLWLGLFLKYPKQNHELIDYL